jgi:acyl-CoA synthetase (AMP-forming)/AMP-acid ligase II
MPNPLSLIPLAAAARGGSIDGIDARQLVAAGVTMLQRCAPLVRELAAGRGVVLLPDSAEYLVALAACEGRGAVLLDPQVALDDVSRALEETDGRVVFTVERHAGAVREGVAMVLLDELPGHVVFVHGDERRRVDVGSHFGLTIEGEEESEGSDEEAIVARELAGGPFRSFTHRELLEAARGVVRAAALEEGDEVLAQLPFHEARGFTSGLLAPLLAGARVVTRPSSAGAAERWTHSL